MYTVQNWSEGGQTPAQVEELLIVYLRLFTCALIKNLKERGKRPNYLLSTLYITHGINYPRPSHFSKLQAMCASNKPSYSGSFL